MTTATIHPPRKRSTAEAPKLTLTIAGAAFSLRGLDHNDFLAFRLRSADGAAYEVIDEPGRAVRDCDDHRRPCEHIRALARLGLISRRPANGIADDID